MQCARSCDKREDSVIGAASLGQKLVPTARENIYASCKVDASSSRELLGVNGLPVQASKLDGYISTVVCQAERIQCSMNARHSVDPNHRRHVYHAIGSEWTLSSFQ